MGHDRSSRPEAPPLRLFVAVDLPPLAQRVVSAAIEPWRQAYPRARWVPAANWHVTLKFLGPTEPRLVATVEEVVAAIASSSPPMQARLIGLGAFPSPNRARVLWTAVDEPAGALIGVAAALDAGLAEEFRADPRGFRPHVTVARSEPPLGLPATYLSTQLSTDAFRIEELVLYRSHLRRPAPRYEPLRTFRLTG